MLFTKWRRVIACAIAIFVLTNSYGILRFINMLADEQQWQPGASIREPWYFRMFIAWPMLSILLALGVGLLQFFFEYIKERRKWKLLWLLALCFMCLLPFASFPSYYINTYEGLWDNQDTMLRNWVYVAGLPVLVGINGLSYLLLKLRKGA
jgi:hypothetical protein